EAGLFGSARAEPPGSGQALLDVAHLGTLFLDELGDLDPRVQERLLQALTAGRYRPPGSTRDREVNVHLIAATRRDLGALVQRGRFRRDLHDRVSGLTLFVPPLRERLEDLPALAASILDHLASEMARCHSAREWLSAFPAFLSSST